jgi:tRNA(Arg) A34 adenosine deaminase TadA
VSERRDAPGVEEIDERMMRAALEEARRSRAWGDVPVGAVVARANGSQ